MGNEWNILHRRILPAGEWLAENAYIAPGFHRLFTAFGLTAGLYAGRKFSNILIARHPNGEEMKRDEVYGPMRHFHGILEYNPYDDSPESRWHSIVDHLFPVIFGAIGAWSGSSYFFRTEKFHPVAQRLARDIQNPSEWFMQHADYATNRVQAKYYNQMAATNFTLGSTTGVHLFPNPFSQAASAIRFQLGAGKKVHAPFFPWLRQMTGSTRSTQSYNMYWSLMDMMQWAENNVAHYAGTPWYKENEAIVRRAKNALQLFENVSPKQLREFEAYIEQTIHKLETAAQKVKAAHPNTHGDALMLMLQKDKEFSELLQHHFWGKGLEAEFEELGLLDLQHPENSKILFGDNGFITNFSRMIGGSEESTAIRRHWEATVKARKSGKKETIDKIQPNLASQPTYLSRLLMGLSAGIFSLSAIGSKHKTPQLDQETLEQLRQKPRHEAAKEFYKLLDEHDPPSLVTAINGAPLDMLHWLSKVFVVSPGTHRLINAGAMSIGLYTGMQFSSALTGKTLRGVPLRRDQIFFAFKPLYKQLDYVWKSNKLDDRWKRVIHQVIPIVTGGIGTYSGSRLFFLDKLDRANRAEYLEDYTEKISLDESESYAKTSGITSILNTGSGAHLMPFASYGSNLQNRFVMASGQQVALPIMGKWWSGNPSKYPYHVRKLLNFTVNYAVNNPSEYPKEFDSLAHALIAKLYPKLTGEELQSKVDTLVDNIYKVRDRYFEPGGIPEGKKEEARTAMEGLLRKDGLEKTLLRLGLNPLEADIDNNGQGGRMARLMGSRNKVKQDIRDYREKAGKRMATWQEETPDTQVTKPQEEPLISKEKETETETETEIKPSFKKRITEHRTVFSEHPTIQ